MKRVLLAGSMNPLNKGDQARIKATINKLTEDNDISVAMLSHSFRSDKAIYSEDNVEIVKAPWSGNSIKLTRLVIFAFITLVKYSFLSFARRFLKLRIRAKLFEYDVLVIASGIDFSDFAGRLPIYYAFFLISLYSIVMRKPVICYAQSMGPIENHVLRRLAKFFLNRMSIVSVRDESSLAFVRELKIYRPIIHLTVDPAFILQPACDKASGILVKYGIQDIRRPLIGMSLNPAPFAGPGNGYCSMGLWYRINKDKADKLSADYIHKMAHLCDRLINLYRATLIFVPNCTAQGDDDRECMNKVHEQMHFKESAMCINSDFTLSEGMKIIGTCDLFLGARLHASILAAIMEVPFVPLVGTDGPRVPSIMKMLGLDNYVRNIMTADESQIMSTVSEVWNMREPMRIMLQSRVGELRKKALTNVSIIREFCSLNGSHPDRSG